MKALMICFPQRTPRREDWEQCLNLRLGVTNKAGALAKIAPEYGCAGFVSGLAAANKISAGGKNRQLRRVSAVTAGWSGEFAWNLFGAHKDEIPRIKL